MNAVLQKERPYRSRPLLDAVHSLPCTITLPEGCIGRPAVPAHSNQQVHGKGGSLKAHDCFVAAACTVAVGTAGCHYEIDDGRRLERHERQRYWRRGFETTFEWLYGLAYIDLPRLTVDRWSQLHPGACWRFPEDSVIAFPANVSDPVWLMLWRNKEAKVL